MSDIRSRKYGVQTTIEFELYEIDNVDLRTDWTPVQVDCEIEKDGGGYVTCDNTALGSSTYKIVLTATEMEFATGALKIVDAVTKVFLDKVIYIETYGHASAQHAFDFDKSAAELVDDILDEVNTGGTHNVNNSLGKQVRQLKEEIGYQGGAVWIDTVNGAAGNTFGENGTVNNPVNNITDALTLAVTGGIVRLRVASGSSITLVAALEGYEIYNSNWTLALGSQSISGSCIIGATISGICTGAIVPKFRDCHFGTATVPPSHFDVCGFAATLTAGSAGAFFFDQCHSAVAGTGSPVFDFGSGLNASNLNVRHYSGGIHIHNMGAGSGSYNMSLEGFGQLIINANCSGGIVAIRGHFTITDNAGAVLTLSNEAMFDHNSIIDSISVGIGVGAITFTYTLTSTVAPNLPIADADVWVTTDIEGINVVASGRTNQNGVVVFYLDAGTVYVWRQKSNWNFDNPDTEVVA